MNNIQNLPIVETHRRNYPRQPRETKRGHLNLNLLMPNMEETF